MREYNQLVDRLYDLELLGEDWDSYGAKPIDEDIVINSHIVLSLLKAHDVQFPTEIFPVPDGSVQLEWTTKGIDIKLNVRLEDYNLLTTLFDEDNKVIREDLNTYSFGEPFRELEEMLLPLLRDYYND